MLRNQAAKPMHSKNMERLSREQQLAKREVTGTKPKKPSDMLAGLVQALNILHGENEPTYDLLDMRSARPITPPLVAESATPASPSPASKSGKVVQATNGPLSKRPKPPPMKMRNRPRIAQARRKPHTKKRVRVSSSSDSGDQNPREDELDET